MRRLTVLLLPLLLFNCHPEEFNENGKGNIKFSVSENTQTGQRQNSTAPFTKLLVTIEDEAGTLVYDMKSVEIYKMNTGNTTGTDTYLSEQLSLAVGNYKLMVFALIDDNNNIFYATPTESSPLANQVSDPLPVNFTVSANATTTIYPELLEVVEGTDFGYANFGFNFTNPIQGTEVTEAVKITLEGKSLQEFVAEHPEFIGVNLTPSFSLESVDTDSETAWIQNFNVAIGDNDITFNHASNNMYYNLKVTLPGFINYATIVLLEDWSISDLVINLQRAETHVLPRTISWSDKTTASITSISNKFYYDSYLREVKNETRIGGALHNVVNTNYENYPTRIFSSSTPDSDVFMRIGAVIQDGNGSVESMKFWSTSLNYSITNQLGNSGLIEKSYVVNLDYYPGLPTQVYHYTYDQHKNLTSIKVYLDGWGYTDGVSLIYEQTFEYDLSNLNAIPSSMLDEWLHSALVNIAPGMIVSSYEFFRIPFMLERPLNAIVRTSFKRYDFNSSTQVVEFSRSSLFNYTYTSSGRPNSLTIIDEQTGNVRRDNFTFTY